MTSLKVNGQVRVVGADADTPLLWVLREELGLTGTKFGCGAAACGACTVHLNGEPVRSCALPVADAAGADIVTIEGIAAGAGLGDGALHPVQRAWIDIQVPQCGYCQSGMIMADGGAPEEVAQARPMPRSMRPSAICAAAAPIPGCAARSAPLSGQA